MRRVRAAAAADSFPRTIADTQAMRHDPDAPTVVLSPHLDDAALSVFAVLDGPGKVLVVNACDGLPPAGVASDWVRLCGGTDDAEQMRARRAEDRAALAAVGRRAIGLGFLEADARPPDATDRKIAARAHAALPAAARLLAPIGMGSHPDHLATRDAAFELASAEEGLALELYADMPYAIRTGWPPWVSDAARDPHLDPAVPWERALSRLPVRRERLIPVVTSLDAKQRIRKARALECYASQVAALAGGPHQRFNDDALAFEVRWTLMPTE
jgi:LmbE family N-acetylglucosaminyl deacetylase